MKRNHNETMEQYRERRAASGRDFKRHMEPRQIWDSKVLGTYVRPKPQHI